jgi:tRNA(Arg) A34 adenosine deaminase TadA
MPSRRQFFGQMTCAVAPLVTGLPPALFASERAATQSAALPFHAVLVDAALPAATALRLRLAPHDATIHEINAGDLTDFWLHTLAPQWRERPVPIAGFTHSAALMCLEQLAWPSGLRVVFHAEHRVRADGTAAHEVHRIAPGQEALTAQALHAARKNWCAPVVESFTRFDAQRRVTAQGLSCAGLEPELQLDERLLTSWIIAPV